MKNIANISIWVGASVLIGYLLTRKKQTKTTMPNSGENYQRLPRGYRNNNPLNIRYSSANNWQGKVLPNTDGSFEQFSSMAYGYRAALYLLRKYITNDKLTTVAGVISKWAPSNENNTSGYINRVCNTTGFLPGTELNPYNQTQMCRLVYAMAIVENGNNPLPSMSEIEAGWKML